MDYFHWDYWMQGSSTDSSSVARVACTAHADCGTGETCGTITLDTAVLDYCVPMDGWCSVADLDTAGAATGTYTDGTSRTLTNSLNQLTVSCATDEYLTWFWQTNNAVDQVTPAGCATVEPECNTITWNGSAGVAAFCGTAKLENDSDYAVLGCYPTADCELMGGLIPGSEAKYILACGATSLFTSAFAASVAIAALL